jgi:hypothetical protein
MQSCLGDEWEAIEEGMPGRTTIYGNIIEKEEDTETGKKFHVEGGPLNRAPRNSILAEILVLQALSVVLQRNANVTPEQYIKHHPHGALCKLRDNERQAKI